MSLDFLERGAVEKGIINILANISSLNSRSGFKTSLGPNLCVGTRRLILKIPNVFLRLNVSSRLDLKPDGRF